MKFKHLLSAAILVLYFVGCSHFNNEVRKACKHGNCKTGWHSQYTGDEQYAALLWATGFPLALLGLSLFLSNKKNKAIQNRERNTKNELLPPIETKTPAPLSALRKSQKRRPPAGPKCPNCHDRMKLSMSNQGADIGKKSWFCVNSPRCKGRLSH